MGFLDRPRLGRLCGGLLLTPVLLVLAGLGGGTKIDRSATWTGIWSPGFRSPSRSTKAVPGSGAPGERRFGNTRDRLRVIPAGWAVPDPGPGDPGASAVLQSRRSSQSAIARTSVPASRSPSRTPSIIAPGEENFHVMVRDGDVAASSNYLPVVGELRAKLASEFRFMWPERILGKSAKKCSRTW